MGTSRTKRPGFRLTLAASAVAHLLFFAQSVPRPHGAPQPTPIEITTVQAVEPGDGKRTPPAKDTRFRSDRDQSVDKETRAARTGAFEAGKPGSTPRGPAPNPTAGGASSLSLRDLGLDSRQKGIFAATDDHLEAVPLGPKTALNSREHRYHAFYERVKRGLRRHWEKEVRVRASRIYATRVAPDDKVLKTRVLALLDAQGRLIQVVLVSGSGFDGLDGIALSAFEKAAPFANPPDRMVDADGFIRLHWEFIVTASGQYRVADNSDLYF